MYLDRRPHHVHVAITFSEGYIGQQFERTSQYGFTMKKKNYSNSLKKSMGDPKMTKQYNI
jgi:hypothetical protein